MSDSDSQNASARDYDEGDEAISNSSSPSTGGSIFNQIDEVERVSPFPEEKDGSARPTASSEDVSSYGPGKSPRVVLSKMFPQLSPHEAEQMGADLPQQAIPRELRHGRQKPSLGAPSRPRTLPAPGEASSSVPGPRLSSASSAPVATSSSDPNAPEADQNADALPATRKKMVFLNSEVVQQQKCLLTRAERTRALTDAAAKISSEVYDYRIFRTPESYKSANLEPRLRSRGEVRAGAARRSSMSPERAFIAPAAAPRPKAKVALGAKKAASKPAADPPIVNVPDTIPLDGSASGGAAPDLQVALGPSRRGKEKRQETEVEEVLTLKRTKRSASTRPADLHEGLRERDALASTLVDQIRDKVPGLETIMGWSCNRLGEQIAEDILRTGRHLPNASSEDVAHTPASFYRRRTFRDVLKLSLTKQSKWAPTSSTGIPRSLRFCRQKPSSKLRPESHAFASLSKSSVPGPRLSSASSAPVATARRIQRARIATRIHFGCPQPAKKMVFLDSEGRFQPALSCLSHRAEVDEIHGSLARAALKRSSLPGIEVEEVLTLNSTSARPATRPADLVRAYERDALASSFLSPDRG
nr:hypothetical protein Iba_chr07aCG2700 [Ipomoea batatas]